MDSSLGKVIHQTEQTPVKQNHVKLALTCLLARGYIPSDEETRNIPLWMRLWTHCVIVPRLCGKPQQGATFKFRFADYQREIKCQGYQLQTL